MVYQVSIMTNVIIKKRTLGAYMAAAKVVKNTQLTAEAVAILQKQWEGSSTAATAAIACSITL